ncbi:lysylphosphatidylglycerol synthase transmembrane domain-containing protein [Rhodopirellula bahusiensis]|uniref:lysylphosphatidylglycerol synthase transmembrane domain-containing protein n=1 Tax=Rhodopirellula bahusiensis TaxID=2014065 RepID=UPI003267827B
MKCPLLFRFARWVVPVAILTWLITGVTQQQWNQLTSNPPNYFLLFFALVGALAAMLLSFLRWRVLLNCLGIDITVTQVFRLGAIGYLFSFIAVGSMGGDVAKTMLLTNDHPGKRLEAIASTVIDRLMGLYGLSLLVAFSLNLCLNEISSPALSSFCRVVNIVAISGTVAFSVMVSGGIRSLRQVTWLDSLPLIGRMLERIIEQVRFFQSRPVALVQSLLMSISAQCLMVVSVYAIARSLYSNPGPPGIAEHFVVVPISLLAAATPLSPAGIGVFEAALDTMYSFIESEESISGTLVGLVFQCVKLMMALAGTIFYWSSSGQSFRLFRRIGGSETAGSGENL